MNLISESYREVKFLFNINDLKNLQSIFQYGLLSKNEKLKRGISSKDLLNPDIQKNVMVKEFLIMECFMIMQIYILILEIR